MNEPASEKPDLTEAIHETEKGRRERHDKPDDKAAPPMSDQLCAIHQARFEIEDAHRLAVGSVEEQAEFDKLKTYLMGRLDELVKLDAEGLDPNQVEERAHDIKHSQAYFKSWAQLRAETPSLLSELQEWRVPEPSRSGIEQQAQTKILDPKLTSADELQAARATFFALLDVHEYWNGYIDWYITRMHCASGTLLGVMAVSLVVALGLFWGGKMLIGMLVAGIAGASVSLLISLPPISVFGETMGLWSRILYRYGVGIAGTAVGCGLLSLGILNILPKDLDFTSLINNEPVQQTNNVHSPPPQPMPMPMPANPSPAGSPPPGPGPIVGAESPPPKAETPPPPPPRDHEPRDREPRHRHPSPRAIAILLAIGLLLGFSERAMGSFESQLFPNPTPPTPPGPKPPA